MRSAIDPHTGNYRRNTGWNMPKTIEKTFVQLVAEYANAVGKFGPESEQVLRLRAIHAHDLEFLDYANSLDRIKRHLGGSGIDKPTNTSLGKDKFCSSSR